MPRRIFTDARVFTARDEDDAATAFSVTDGVIDGVGEIADLLRGDDVELVSLGGRTVLPGLLDMHIHPGVMVTVADSVDVLPPAVRSLEQLFAALRSHPAVGTGPEAWIVGSGYDDTKYPEGRPPTASELDAEVSADQPVLIWRCDRHSAVANSRALEIAGVTAATPDPPGARIERDEWGEPTGVLTEINATRLVGRHVPVPDRDERIARALTIGARLLSRGITGACDLLATAIPDPLETFRAAAERGRMPRLALFYGWDPAAPPRELTDDDRSGRIRFAGLKIIMDGAYSNRTAWVNESYPDSDDHGVRTLDDASALAAAVWCRRNGVQLAVHAMGDRAIEAVIDLFGAQEPWLDEGPSIRIEHATLLTPASIARLRDARMTFGIATHTVFLFAEYDGYAANLHPDQMPAAYPIRSLYRELPHLALSSDCPATAWSEADDPFVSVEAAVRRRAYDGSDIGQDAAITIRQALLLYTSRAATLTRVGPIGALAPGFAADFVVLDRDVLASSDDAIAETGIDETWIDGELAWSGR